MAAVNIRNLGALVNLGVHFAIKVVSYPFVRLPDRKDVEAAFAPDGVRSVRPDERAIAPAAHRCTACGRCDSVVSSGIPPSLLIPRLGREPPDAAFARGSLGPLREHCEAIMAVCPERVDVRGLLFLVDRAST